MTEADERNVGGLKRWLWILPLVTILAIAGIVAGIVKERRELAETLIASRLRALGLTDVTHRVDFIGTSRIGLRDVHVGPDDVVADEIDVHYSLPKLRRGRIDSLSVRGLRVRARMDDAGISFGTLDSLRESDDEATTEQSPPLTLPVESVFIEGFSIAVATAEGTVDAAGTLSALVSESGAITGRFDLTSTVPQLGRISPVASTGTATLNGDAIDFAFESKSAQRVLAIRGSGHHDLSTGDGEMRIDSDPLAFRSGGLQPVAFWPSLKGSIESMTGTIDSKGTLRWNAAGEIRSGFDLGLRDVSVASELGSIDRLNAAIHVDGPQPFSTPAKQLISMAQIDFGLPLQNGLISFQLRRDGLLDVSSAEWTLAGGKVRTHGRFDPLANSQSFVLDLVDLDLAALLELVDLSGLTGTGQLSGRIPVKRRGSTLEIRDGVLSGSPAGGWIRYAPDAGMAAAASQDQDFNVVLSALRNFRYRELSLTLDGDTDGPVDVAIHLAGANPDYLSGHPVEFNLNVNSHLVDLLRKASAGYRIPQQIEKRLKEISEGQR